MDSLRKLQPARAAREYQLYRYLGFTWIMERQSDSLDELTAAAIQSSQSTGEVYGVGRKGDKPFTVIVNGIRFIAM